MEALPEEHEINLDLAKQYFHKIEKEACRNLVLNENAPY